MELYKKYRPTKFSQVLGQESVLRNLADLGKKDCMPHCILLTGPSGVGKTTVARILRKKLGCSDHDYVEMNLADLRGIDEARKIRERMGLAPIGGSCRVFLLDEVHRTTKDFQNAMLKLLEDTPEHVYFILATTDPERLIKTVITRCTPMALKPLERDVMLGLLVDVCRKEDVPVSDEVIDKIIEAAEGSPRQALVYLDKVIYTEGEEKQLEELAKVLKTEAIELARLLMKKTTNWATLLPVLNGLKQKEEDAEGLRRMVLGYCSSVLLKKADERAALIISRFIDPLYDVGWPGLVFGCYEVVCGDV